ncbi:hypothetical protein BTW15_15020 [Pseudomonas syringae pv. tomato]|nr:MULTISPECIES: hypothetical protein [Pseudomonas syringae group]KPB81453.1 Uncharacterized protein AC505_2180 [Pseudomonas syringae pv. maculicola]MBI6848526.1 hypothetical protein [Pseudomonas syringae]MBX6510755.1 hypothetical protein [Pseudomonas syringae pv. tomato]OPE59303.1 hypothetical protein BTW15_15020 [Pseudomonas syringae pv. tomato]RMT23271.1 hypothetical protein ALP50_01819 [Pseudomonas syringae pv. spinaceae]
MSVLERYLDFFQTLIACFAGVIFGIFLYFGLMTLLDGALRWEHSLYASIVGAVIGVFSLRLLPWAVHLAGLAGMVLGVLLALVLAGYVWPEMAYEHIPGYFLIAGLAGMLCAGLLVYRVLKVRPNQQM